jgi:hypothetical protein
VGSRVSAGGCDIAEVVDGVVGIAEHHDLFAGGLGCEGGSGMMGVPAGDPGGRTGQGLGGNSWLGMGSD